MRTPSGCARRSQVNRNRLLSLIAILAIAGAGTGAAIYLSDWKKRAELTAGDPLYGDLMSMLSAAEIQYGIPTDLLARQAYEESRFRPDIIDGSTPSSAGALGLMQFMPATAAQLGINPLDPQQAVNGAAQYLVSLYHMFGTWTLALAAYNAGEGNVKKYGGIPPFPQTQGYVADILGDVNAEGGPQIA